jgi:hypothetical protein
LPRRVGCQSAGLRYVDEFDRAASSTNRLGRASALHASDVVDDVDQALEVPVLTVLMTVTRLGDASR